MERSEIKEQVLEVFMDVFGDELSCAGGGALMNALLLRILGLGIALVMWV